MSARYENMTLRQALDSFRKANGLDEKYAQTGDKSKSLMDRHDTIHILIGTDTSFPQEAITDYFTIFGSDAKWSDLKQYFDLPEQKELVAEHGWPKLVWASLVSIPSAIRIAIKTRKLKRKWPWNSYENYLDQPVGEIRQKYGIDGRFVGT